MRPCDSSFITMRATFLQSNSNPATGLESGAMHVGKHVPTLACLQTEDRVMTSHLDTMAGILMSRILKTYFCRSSVVSVVKMVNH